jgi:hypothetical protein
MVYEPNQNHLDSKAVYFLKLIQFSLERIGSKPVYNRKPLFLIHLLNVYQNMNLFFLTKIMRGGKID